MPQTAPHGSVWLHCSQPPPPPSTPPHPTPPPTPRKERKRNSPQYPQMVMMFSVSPNRWTTETRTLLVRTIYAMMLVSLRSLTKTRWTHGLCTMLGCSMLNLSGQAMSFLSSLQLLASLPVCPWPWSTKHSTKWNATRLLFHLASWLRCWKLLGRKELSWRDNWQRLLSAVVWSHQTGRRASFWPL